jgi:hypothetical protein
MRVKSANEAIAGFATRVYDERSQSRVVAEAWLARLQALKRGPVTGGSDVATKTNFTPEEWKQLLESPMLASMAVTAAEPSGLWGVLKESFAAGGALAKAKVDAGANELIKAVIADFDTAEGRAAARDGLQARLSGGKPAEVKDKAIAGLRQVAALLDAKAPGDAAAFKSWLQSIGQHVAEAAKEGGFLGFGGVQVSETEKATLAEISNALRLKA